MPPVPPLAVVAVTAGNLDSTSISEKDGGFESECHSVVPDGDPMDYTVRGILQARILEWVGYPFSSGSSALDQLGSPALQVDSLPTELSGKPSIIKV